MSSGWNFGRSDWKTSKPIGKAAEDFLYENCEYAVYVRIREEQPCQKHWDFFSSSQNMKRLVEEPCPVCWGFGKRVDPIIIPIRTSLGSPKSLDEPRLRPGYSETWEISGYVPRILKPKSQDFVIFAEWNIPFKDIPTDPRRRITRFHDVTQINSLLIPLERENSFVGIGLKAYNFEMALINQNLQYTYNLPILKREEWNNTTYW